VAASLAVMFRRVWLMELDSFEFDDAFMFIRYAENLLDGHGYTWNAGDPAIFGVTSILFTWIITLVKGLFGGMMSNSWVLVATALGFALAFLLILQGGMFRTVRSPLLKDRLSLALLTIPFLVLPLIFGFHISTGMETTLSLFLNTAMILAVIRYAQEDGSSWKWLAMAAVTAWLTYLARPDNALTMMLFPVFYLVALKRFRHLPVFLGLLILLLAADSLVKFLVFGDVLPLSYYTKKSGFTEGYTAKYFWNPVKYLTTFTAYTMPYILLIFAFADRKHAKILAAFLVPVAMTFAYFFTFDQIMGFDARLYFPFLPFLIVPALLVLDDFLVRRRATPARPDRNVLFRRFALLLAFLFLTVYSKYRFINKYESYAIREGNKGAIAVPDLEDRRYDREQSIRKISELLKGFPDDFVFAATEHGYLSGDNPGKRILDLSGLHNYTIATTGYNDSILAEEQPDLIWMPHQDLTVLHHDVRTGAYFKENYTYITGVYAFGCAVRNGSRYYEQLMDEIK
jgi:hypothetical protein